MTTEKEENKPRSSRRSTIKLVRKSSSRNTGTRKYLNEKLETSRNISVTTRGEEKIKMAADKLGVDFEGCTVLDIGSSTGGFTKFALEKGAKKVFAVEKGTNQMQKPLRFDPRVELHEKTDVFLLTGEEVWGWSASDSGAEISGGQNAKRNGEKREAKNSAHRKWTEEIDIVVADVSFVSLKKVLKKLKKLLPQETKYFVMMKPQFEAKKEQLTRGVVKNEKMRREIIKNFEQWLRKNKFFVQRKCDNKLAGRKGNIERFYLISNE